MDWMTILAAAFLVMMIVYIWPRFKQVSENSRKAEKGEWMSAIIPLAAVALFVLFLILAV